MRKAGASILTSVLPRSILTFSDQTSLRGQYVLIVNNYTWLHHGSWIQRTLSRLDLYIILVFGLAILNENVITKFNHT